MTEPPKSPKSTQPAPIAPAPSGLRQERLAAALRANLGRRKAQARQRASAAEPPAAPPKRLG